MTLRIDPEFESQIPPLTEDEFTQLEENILEDGVVIHPIVVWDGVIVDGHNRFRIIEKHPHITYTIHEMDFPDRYAAIVWICRNQLGRRNLTPEQKKYLIGTQYTAEKKSNGGNRGVNHDEKGRFTTGGQNVHLWSAQKTSERIAEENNVNERYVRRAEHFAKGIDLADEIDPGIRKEILSGKIRPTDKEIHAVVKAKPEERHVLVEELRKSASEKRQVFRKEKSLPFQPKPPETTLEQEGEKVVITEETAIFSEPEESLSAVTDTVSIPQNPPQEVKKPDLSPRMAQKISDEMLHTRGRATKESILVELEDALDSLVFRWSFCLGNNLDIFETEDCLMEVCKLTRRGFVFLKEIEGGSIPQ